MNFLGEVKLSMLNLGTDFYLIRHGEAELNLVDIVGGRSNSSPLTQKGIEQAKNLTARLRKIGFSDALIVTSPAVRCVNTLMYSLGKNNIGFSIDCALQELEQGEWVGKPRREVYTSKVRAEIEDDPWNFKAPGGESQAEVAERVKLTISQNYLRSPKIIFFTHGGTIKYLCADLFGWNNAWKINVDNASITHLKYDGKWDLIEFNG